MKKGWIIALAVFLLLIGVAVGISVYNKGKTDEINIVENKRLADEVENIIYTSTTEEKISPNAKILKKRYFIGCDHLLKETEEVPEELINKNKSETEKYYKGWDVDSFSSNEVTIYKQEEGFCDQHYLIKEHNGVLGIYTIDENGKLQIKEDTEIQTRYLTDVDLEKVKTGIEAIGNTELNSVLEDFE